MQSPVPEFLKFYPSDFELETTRVVIRPLKEEDYDAYFQLSREKNTWQFFNKDLSDETELRRWFDEAVRDKSEGKRMPFTIIDKDTRQIAGSTSYGNISFFDKRIEIGWSWLGPGYIGMGVNKHVKFSLISYAFEVMKMERVEAKTDVLNEKAKGGLIKAGMIPEGVLRSHTQMHSGRRRDTIFFGLIKNEWPERRKQFYGEMI